MSELGMNKPMPVTVRAAWPKVALLVAAAALLGGCESNETAYRAEPRLSVEQRYPIAVTEEPVILEIPVIPGTYSLTSSQRSEIATFLNDYRNRGTGSLEIRAPSGTRNEQAALGAVDEIRTLVRDQGISPAAVSYRAYSGRRYGSAYPPVVLGYKGVAAASAPCGDWSESIVNNPKNGPYLNYGCATQKNLAAMIDNPRDLETPRTMDAASSERRSVVRGKYIAGEPTGAKTQDGGQGTVSSVGQ